VLDELRLFLQVRHQTLERLRQHADLVAGGDADFHAVVPVLHPARRERQPADRARDLAGEHVRRLALATRRVQDGDYSVEIGVPSGDEIGMLSQAFQSLVADLKEKAKLVEYMMAASGAAPTEPVRSARPSSAP